MKDFTKEIKDNDILVFVIPNKDYSDSLEEIVKTLSKMYNKICYISLNKPHNSLLKTFEEGGMDTEKFLFIDAVGKGSNEKNVIYVSSPKALTELSITINKVISGGLIDSSLFDSLSTLLVYEEASTVIKFSHSIISTFRNKGVKAVLTCLEGDVKSELIKDLSMFADKIVEFG